MKRLVLTWTEPSIDGEVVIFTRDPATRRLWGRLMAGEATAADGMAFGRKVIGQAKETGDLDLVVVVVGEVVQRGRYGGPERGLVAALALAATA